MKTVYVNGVPMVALVFKKFHCRKCCNTYCIDEEKYIDISELVSGDPLFVTKCPVCRSAMYNQTDDVIEPVGDEES